MEAPEPGTGTILVQRFHIHVPLALVRGRTDDFAQTKLRLRITIQDTFLRALFIVDHKLNSNARAAWPLGVGRHSPVSHEVARVRGRRRPASAPCSAHANRAALHAATHWRPRRGAHCITGWVRQVPGMTAGRASLTLAAVSSLGTCPGRLFCLSPKEEVSPAKSRSLIALPHLAQVHLIWIAVAGLGLVSLHPHCQ